VPSEFDEVVREIGLSQGVFSEAQVETAFNKLRQLEAQGQQYTLPVVLEGMQLISETDRMALENAAAYRVHRDADKEIARIIRESGYSEINVVDRVLTEQKEHYRATGETLRIGPVLVSRGFLSEAQRIAAEKLYQLGGPPELNF
jgi:hypothetical protein